MSDEPHKRGSGPFIHRALRPEVDSQKPAPPLLALSASPTELSRQAGKVLREGRTERLDLDGPAASALQPRQSFAPNADLISTQLDGEAVLLDVRTARSYSLNRVGTVIWALLAGGRTLEAVRSALCRRFDVPARVAWGDLTALVRELRREKLLRARPPLRGRTPKRRITPVAPSRRLSAASSAAALPALFALQVVGLEKDGWGILVAAAEGWEKSPACRALLRAGFRRLGGSGAWLRETSGRLRVSATASLRNRRRKSAIRGGQSGSDTPIEITPRLLIFPQTVDWPESSLEPLCRSRALEKLLPLTLVMKERDLTPRQFHTLARLIELTDCYRLHCGEDVTGLPELFDRVLRRRANPREHAKKPKRTPR
jgi:hypothetical protein